jgi:hypothetical protein
MQRAEIAQRVPDVIGGRVDDDVFVDGSHGKSLLKRMDVQPSLRAKRSNPSRQR